MPLTIGFVRIVKMQTFPEAGRFMGFLLGLSENTILFLPPHHTILQNSINYNKENEVFEDSMQVVIIPPRFKDNYQILGLPREWGYISSLWTSLHPSHISGIFNVTFTKPCILPFKAESWWHRTALWQEEFPGRAATVQDLFNSCSVFMENIKSSLPPFLGMLVSICFQARTNILYCLPFFCTSSRLTWRGLMLSRLRTFYSISYFPIGEERNQ